MNQIYVSLPGDGGPSDALILEVGENLFPGYGDLEPLRSPIPSICSDLLLLAAAIFAADRSVERGNREDISRAISISVPVVNTHRLTPLLQQVERTLYRLTDDAWSIELRPTQGILAANEPFQLRDGLTILFSGGVDSLAATLEYGPQAPSLLLVSHITRNQNVVHAQRTLADLLRASGLQLDHLQVFVSSKTAGLQGAADSPEPSQRSRSFLFLVVGAIATVLSGNKNLLFMAENGQLAINLPLTVGRVGAFSTHTAHPQVLTDVEDLVNVALNTQIQIRNPYMTITKAEVAAIVNARLPDAMGETTSCWRNARLPRLLHCGVCVPCLFRRIALEVLGNDPTAYADDPWSGDFAGLPIEDEGRRNTADIVEFSQRFISDSNAELVSEFPELVTFPIPTNDVIDMYRRAAKETVQVLSRYTSLAPILS